MNKIFTDDDKDMNRKIVFINDLIGHNNLLRKL